MPQAITKLFRNPDDAHKALIELHSHGYKAEELGALMARTTNIKPIKDIHHKSVDLPGVGAVTAFGNAVAACEKADGKDLRATLAELWGVPPEIVDYYEMGIPVGGVVVSIQSEGDRLSKAKELLRTASREAAKTRPNWAKNSSFAGGGRMAGTNPVDAPMSGDFRKY